MLVKDFFHFLVFLTSLTKKILLFGSAFDIIDTKKPEKSEESRMAVKSKVKKQIKKQARKNPSAFFSFVLVLALLFCGAYYLDENGYVDLFPDDATIDRTPTPVADGTVELHFIDVGQADAALIKTPDGNIMIDTGLDGTSGDLLEYLGAQGVDKIKYMIFTHPHDDHMGSAATVLSSVEVEEVIMNDRTSTAKFYERALDVIEEKDIPVTVPKIGDVFVVGDFKMTILAPKAEEYEGDDTNNSSIVILAEFGSTSFMFTGDAEDVSEKEILSTFGEGSLKCDLLKVGHHASPSSTTEEFLTAISPKYAVISVGKNNYGHPSQVVLDRLTARGVTYYTTQENGTIVFVSDGSSLTKR